MEKKRDAVRIPSGPISLEGDLVIPTGATGLVIFVHGSGSSRFSPRNVYVADVLNDAGIGTLLFDLLTDAEDRDANARFDIDLLTARLLAATAWVRERDTAGDLALGYFGASTGAAAALKAAAVLGPDIRAVVSRGGRPDLADEALPRVSSPTLLLVGGDDDVVIGMNERAFAAMRCEKELKIVPGATHLFEEPGALEEVARLAASWFSRHLA